MMWLLHKQGYKLANTQADLTPLQSLFVLKATEYEMEEQTKQLEEMSKGTGQQGATGTGQRRQAGSSALDNTLKRKGMKVIGS